MRCESLVVLWRNMPQRAGPGTMRNYNLIWLAKVAMKRWEGGRSEGSLGGGVGRWRGWGWGAEEESTRARDRWYNIENATDRICCYSLLHKARGLIENATDGICCYSILHKARGLIENATGGICRYSSLHKVRGLCG